MDCAANGNVCALYYTINKSYELVDPKPICLPFSNCCATDVYVKRRLLHRLHPRGLHQQLL
ncbi:MAG: hypothetical protein WC966_02720 [Bradymonadales bacterium]